MHSRHRSSGDGFRPGGGYASNHRGFAASAARRGPAPHPKAHHPTPPPPPPPPRKADIFLEAGRLAAEYFVSKGILPADILPPLPPDSARPSALARLGASAPRRRLPDDDDYDRRGPRNRWKARRRSSPYGSRSYYSSDWGGRENGRERSYLDSREDDDEDDDIAPGFSRGRREGFGDGGGGPRDGPPALRSEVVGETVPESENFETVDDTASKVSSSNVKKDPQVETEVDSNKDIKASSSEIREEERGDENGDVEMKSLEEEEDVAVEGSDQESKNGGDLLKLLSFAKVPTRPRSSVAQRNAKVDEGFPAEAVLTASKADTGETSKVVVDEIMVEGDRNTDRSDGLKCEAVEDASVHAINSLEQAEDAKYELSQSRPDYGTTPMTVEVREEDNVAQDIGKEELKENEEIRDMSPPEIVQVNDSYMHDETRIESSKYHERIAQDDEENVGRVEENTLGATLFMQLEAESNVKLQEERQLQPTSFKIRDLNLMESPEITDIPDDPPLDHFCRSGPTLGTDKDLSVDFSLQLTDNIENADKYSQLPGDDKVVPIINLEDDSPEEVNVSDSSQPKSDSMYSSMDVLNRTEQTVDLPSIQDGYGLVPPELLGNDIAGCPSVQSDLNNLQTGFGLPDGEVFPGDDIYVSLGEIPIGFMEVWDQQHQEYGNFF